MVAKSSRTRSVGSNDEHLSPEKRFFKACHEGSVETVKRIFEVDNKGNKDILKSYDIDDDRRQTPLMVACREGHDKVAELLIELGSSLHQVASTGAIALYMAAKEGRLECLKLCLSKGSKINNLTYSGNTPLWIAADRGHTACVQELIDRGADVNHPSRNGETPLITAANSDFVDCVKVLIAAGADLNAVDDLGWNALSIATRLEFRDVIKVLTAADAIATGPPKFPIDESFSSEKKENPHGSHDVDEMKIKTMYKMVEDCKVVCQGKEVTKKVLYVTNKQASMFDEDLMSRVVDALEIGSPKFVIKLLGSLGSSTQMALAHPEELNTVEVEYGKTSTVSSEISKDDERVVETQLILFMKTCILPLAMQTKALILVNGANDCMLSAALSRIAVSEQARLGKDCPFTVLATASEREVHSKAASPDVEDKNTIASQIARNSQSWRKRIVPMNDFWSATMKIPGGAPLQECDLTEAAERYIIFEGYDDPSDGEDLGSYNGGPRKAFESLFLQYMTRKLPSIAIQCFDPDQGVPFLVDLASRNIPVLLLDTTERCFTSSNYDPKTGPMTQLARESNAFPSISADKLKQIKIKDGRLTDDGMDILLAMAMEMVQRKLDVLAKYGVIDNLQTSLLAFFHRVLTIGNEVGTTFTGDDDLFSKIVEMERSERTSKESKKARVSPELATRVMEFITTRVAAMDIVCQFNRVEKWIQKNHRTKKHMLIDAIEYKNKLEKQVAVIIQNGNCLKDFDLDATSYLASFDVLSNPNTYSGNVFDIDHIKRILGSVAKIDRLPTSNSLEALRILQDSWDHVEVYHLVADSYKRISKMTYVLLLLSGIAVVVYTQINAVWGFDAKVPILILSFIGTVLAAYISFTNPVTKWQQLRVAALSIESNIWTFRTRSGPYRNSGEEFDHSSEELLADVIQDIKTGVLEGADVKSTSFYSTAVSQNKHNQHDRNHPYFGAVDNYAKAAPEKRSWFSSRKSGDVHDHQDHISKAKKKQAKEASKVDEQFNKKFLDKFAVAMIHHRPSTAYPWQPAASPSASSRSGAATGDHSSPSKKNAAIELTSPRSSHALNNNNNSTNHVDRGAYRDSKLSSYSEGSEFFDFENEERDSAGIKHTVVDMTDHYKNLDKGTSLNAALEWLTKQDDEPDAAHRIHKNKHFEPLQPDLYIRYRIVTSLEFYKAKIPQCSRIRNLAQSLIVLGSIGSAILAIVNLATWSAVVSVTTASITAYLEFLGTNSKISRYSSTVHALQELVYWWQTLPQIDRSVVSNIDHLVLTCEELLQREQQAWRSSSQASKMMSKQSGQSDTSSDDSSEF